MDDLILDDGILVHRYEIGRRTFIKGATCLLALYSLLPGCATIPDYSKKESGIISNITDPITGRTIFSKESYTGLDMNVIPMPRVMAYANFTTGFGSAHTIFNDELGKKVEIPDGTAHFLEHLVYRREDLNLIEVFKGLGAVPNAYTSLDHTGYHIEFISRLEKNLSTLISSVLNLEFTEEQMKKERGAILEEKSGRDGKVGTVIFLNLLDSLFHTPYGNTGVGSEEEIEELITPEIVRHAHNLFYRPSNMHFTLAGDCKPEHIFELVEGILKDIGAKKTDIIAIEDYDEPVHSEEKSMAVEMPYLQMPHFIMGFKHIPSKDPVEAFKETIMLELAADIIFSASSELSNELNETNMIPGGFGAGYLDMKGYGFTEILAITPDPDKLEKRVLQEIDKFRNKGVSLRDFERILQKNIGSSVRRFDDAEALTRSFVHYRLKDSNLFERLGHVLDMKNLLPELNSLLKEHYVLDKSSKVLALPKS